MIPRFLHKLYANFMGYYWMPCLLCGKFTGGHESDQGGTLMETIGSGTGCCNDCIPRAMRLNESTGWGRNPTPEVKAIFAKDRAWRKANGYD